MTPEAREAAGLIAYLHRSRDAVEQMQRDLAEQARRLEDERRELREEWVARQRGAHCGTGAKHSHAALAEHERQMARAIEAVKDRELRAQTREAVAAKIARGARRGAQRGGRGRGGAPFGVAGGSGQSRRMSVRPPALEELVAGVRVRVRGLPAPVVLRRRDGASAEVEAGPLRMKVPLAEITAVVREEAARARTGAGAGARSGAAESGASAGGSAGTKTAGAARAASRVHTSPADRETGGAGDEINVIGCTVEEASRRVDKFIDNAALAGKPAGARDSRPRHGRVAARAGGISLGASAGRKRSRGSAGARGNGGNGGGAARLIEQRTVIRSNGARENMAEAGSFADRVKQQADIVRVVGEYVRLKKNGQNFTGLCPFHSEKTPSFAVHPVKQIYHCFGCGAGGDVFKFVMEMDKCDFLEAVRTVADKCGIAIPQSARTFAGGAARAAAAHRAGGNASRSGGVFCAATRGHAGGQSGAGISRGSRAGRRGDRAVRIGLCAFGRRRAAAASEGEISGEADGSWRDWRPRSERAAVRPLPAAHHVSDRERSGQSDRVRRAGAGRRPAEVFEFARDADLHQEHACCTTSIAPRKRFARPTRWFWSRATWTRSPWRARASATWWQAAARA